jgi:GNAT superfamily N-acetyltransferase
MTRPGLSPRIARLEDASALAELWSDVIRRVDRSDQVADLELVIKAAAESPEQRFIVVEHDGQVAGSVFLRMTTVSPLNLEPCVQSIQPRVFPQYRRRGVGRMLMEAAVAFAEENGILHVTTAVPATARDANRFMARIALAPAATLRIAPTSVVRSRLSPAAPTGPVPSTPRVLVARRNLRRARAAQSDVPLPD